MTYGNSPVNMEQLTTPRSRGLDLSVRAQTCAGNRTFWVGDLITYRAGLWVVKGVYVSGTRSGTPELYYILAEASPSLDGEGEMR